MPNFAVIPSPERSQPKPGPRRAINRHSRLTQALDLQDILTSVAKSLKCDLDHESDPDKRARLVVAIASSGRSWQGLQGEVMALRGQGKPKTVEARNAHTAKRKPRASGPVPPPKQEPEPPAPVP